VNSIGYPSESVSSSKWHVLFASRCPGRRLSTWQMIAASCPTALGWRLSSDDMRSSHLFVCGNQPSCCQPVFEWHDTLGNCPTAHHVNVTSQCLMCRRVIRQLTFRLAWCREHSAVAATELLQPLDLACGTLFRSSCAIQTSPADCSDHS